MKQITNLSIAGHSCVIKQEIGTKEKDHSIKYSQECPINEYTPAQVGILGNIPENCNFDKLKKIDK